MIKKKNETLETNEFVEETLENNEVTEENLENEVNEEKETNSDKITELKKNVKKSVKSFKNLKGKRKFTVIKNIVLCLLMLFGIGSLLTILGFLLFIIITSPDFNTKLLYDKEATVLYDVNGNEFARIGVENRELVTYDELPQVLVDAIVATEDSRFFQHDGFDIARFAKASIGQVFGHKDAGGASTLTMQIVKNTYTSNKRSITRKFTDIYMAIFKIERKYTKEEILEFYVNKPWLGEGSYGVEQASQTYFGKSVKDLTLTEAALLAGMFQAPASYDPYIYPKNCEARRNLVLDLMVRHGYITKEQADIAKAVPVESLLTTQRKSQSKYQDYIDTVIEDVIEKTGNDPYNIPMEIYTTMDPTIQEVIIKVENGESYKFVNDVVQMSVAITSTKDGSIVAIGSGRNRKGEREFNRATMMNRHPGSTAKPIFAYGPYIEYNNGSTYSMFLDDSAKYSNGQSLKNADGGYHGLQTMRTALVESRNVPAVLAFQKTDNEKIAEFASNLHINYGGDLYESCAIGGFNGVSPVELSAAYAAFGRGGYYIEPYTFTKIHYLDTDETYEHKPKQEQAMSEATAYMITDMLVTGGNQGVGGKIHVSGTEVAAKSGTSTVDSAYLKKYGIPFSASMDNWINTYSPDYSISLWYGYDEISKDYYTTSIGGANVRKALMTIIANKVFPKNSKFTRPSSVVTVEVETETFPAMLPSEFTPSDKRVKELFKKGTEPTDVSPRYDRLKNPTNVKAKINGNMINVTWDHIATPDGISDEYLNSIFNEDNYGSHVEKYLNKRREYNNGYIGTVGYQVYIKDASGNLTNLGYTTSNSYDYAIINPSNDYTFVVKSAYSIFKDNMSTGAEVSISSTTPVPTNPVTPTPTPSEPTTPTPSRNCDDEISITTPVNYSVTNEVYNKYDDISVNGSPLTSKPNMTFYVWENGTYRKNDVTGINLNNRGKYKIEYSFTYNECPYSVQRIVNVN